MAWLRTLTDYVWSFWGGVDKHDTTVVLLRGPSDNHVLQPGETFSVEVAWLPQNRAPSTTTHIFLYVGPRGMEKDVYELMSESPGEDPRVELSLFEYTVPDGIYDGINLQYATEGSSVILEIGWGEERGCTIEAARVRQKRGRKHSLLHSLPVAPSERNHWFKVSLCTPLPRTVVAGNVLVLDLATLLQNNYPNIRSCIYVYLKEVTGVYHYCCIQDELSEERPRLVRGGVACRIPESLVGQKLKVGWASAVQSGFGDEPSFNPNTGSKLGVVEVVEPGSTQSFTGTPLPKKMNQFIRDYRREAERAGQGARPANEALIMGAHRLVASLSIRAVLVGLLRGSGRPGATSDFGKILKSVMDTESAVPFILGEVACSYVFGQLGERLGFEQPQRAADRLCERLATGAQLASIVSGEHVLLFAATNAVRIVASEVEFEFSFF